MRYRGRIAYLLSALALAGLAVAYAEHRELRERWRDFRASQEKVDAVRAEVFALEESHERARQRVESLDADPLELEAAIRHNKLQVRDEHERVYRLRPAPEAGSGQTSP